MIRRLIAIALAGVALLAGLNAYFRPGRLLRVATAMTAQTLCSGVFVSELPPERIFDDGIRPMPGVDRIASRLAYTVDREHSRVTVKFLGGFAGSSRYRPGLGCTVEHDADLRPAAIVLPPPPAGSPVVDTGEPWRSILIRAFAEPNPNVPRRVKAIVILHDGHIVAERYAAGYKSETQVPGYSLSKSIINALTGILVRQGKLQVNAPAPVGEWRESDPRHAITLDHLLRMTSGLDIDEETSGSDPVSRMLFLESDMAAFAEKSKLRATPGKEFRYTSGSTLIVSHLIRTQAGGRAQDVVNFARHELFEPLGMNRTTLAFDTAGTPVGGTNFLATARDWAKLGELYRLDGMAPDGRRILPEGWVKYSTTQTLASDYGAGFWLNPSNVENAQWRMAHGMPADAFYGSGAHGQRIVVLPSQKMVIVRLSWTFTGNGDMPGLVQLVKDSIAATGPAQGGR